jgi:hypothetical protein
LSIVQLSEHDSATNYRHKDVSDPDFESADVRWIKKAKGGVHLMTAEMIYHAFISHAHEDARVARWLHRALETYRVPLGVRVPTGAARLIGSQPFYPCFLDREELRSGELSEQIIDAVRRSRNLVVLCSIHSRESEWVELEVAEFLKNNPVTRVFPVLTGDTGALQEIDLFPKSLRAALKASEGEIGALSLLAKAYPLWSGNT